MKKIDRLRAYPNMAEAIDLLDQYDLSPILDKYLTDINRAGDIINIIDRHADPKFCEPALTYFFEDTWITYLEERYNLEFIQRIEYICFNPGNGVHKLNF